MPPPPFAGGCPSPPSPRLVLAATWAPRASPALVPTGLQLHMGCTTGCTGLHGFANAPHLPAPCMALLSRELSASLALQHPVTPQACAHRALPQSLGQCDPLLHPSAARTRMSPGPRGAAQRRKLLSLVLEHHVSRTGPGLGEHDVSTLCSGQRAMRSPGNTLPLWASPPGGTGSLKSPQGAHGMERAVPGSPLQQPKCQPGGHLGQTSSHIPCQVRHEARAPFPASHWVHWPLTSPAPSPCQCQGCQERAGHQEGPISAVATPPAPRLWGAWLWGRAQLCWMQLAGAPPALPPTSALCPLAPPLPGVTAKCRRTCFP